MPQKPHKPECLLLGNGPSLSAAHSLRFTIPRDSIHIVGLNQSWRLFPDADAHVFVDQGQLEVIRTDRLQHREAEANLYFQRLHKLGALFHTGSGDNLGRPLDHHNEVIFGRHPFKKRDCSPAPSRIPLSENGGVSLRAGVHGAGGSVGYIALQIVAAMGFEKIWMAGFDMAGGKFTGEKSHSVSHDKLWANVPDDVKARVRVIAPSATRELTIVEWPWSEVASAYRPEVRVPPIDIPRAEVLAFQRAVAAPCW